MSTAARADPDAPAFPQDAIEVGRVLGAWGIKGGIRVKPFASDPQALFSSKRWFLKPAVGPVAAARPGATAIPESLKVMTAKEHGDGIVATAQELPDRNAAEALRGARVFVARSSFPTPAEDEFYWVDLIGLAVHNRAGLSLGSVVGLIETGPHCVLRILPASAPVASAEPGAAGQQASAPAGALAGGSAGGSEVGPAGAPAGEPSGGVAAEVLIPFVDAYVDKVDIAARLIVVDWDSTAA